MRISNQCWIGRRDPQRAECGLGHESGSALHARKLLPLCLSFGPSYGSVESGCDVVHLPAINGTSRSEDSQMVADLIQDGGLYCDSNGQISKPFPSKPYCVAGTGSVGAQNLLGDSVAFCQTVLPGNEAMLIPTSVSSWSQLAVPDTSYWCSTAAQ